MTLVRSNVSLFTRHHFSSNVIEGVVRIERGRWGIAIPKPFVLTYRQVVEEVVSTEEGALGVAAPRTVGTRVRSSPVRVHRPG